MCALWILGWLEPRVAAKGHELKMVVPSIGIKMEKLRHLRSDIPDTIVRLKTLWETGIDLRAARDDAAFHVDTLLPCMVCIVGCGRSSSITITCSKFPNQNEHIVFQKGSM